MKSQPIKVVVGPWTRKCKMSTAQHNVNYNICHVRFYFTIKQYYWLLIILANTVSQVFQFASRDGVASKKRAKTRFAQANERSAGCGAIIICIMNGAIAIRQLIRKMECHHSQGTSHRKIYHSAHVSQWWECVSPILSQS
jgi:hypothetical protein